MTEDRNPSESSELSNRIRDLELELEKKETELACALQRNECLQAEFTSYKTKVDFYETMMNSYPQAIFFSKENNHTLDPVNPAAHSFDLGSCTITDSSQYNDYITKNGSTLRDYTKSLTEEKERVTMHILQDISDLIQERNTSRQQNKEKEQEIKDLFNNQPTALLRVDQNGKIIETNLAATSLFSSYKGSMYDIVDRSIFEDIRKHPGRTYQATTNLTNLQTHISISVLYSSYQETVVSVIDNTPIIILTKQLQTHTTSTKVIQELPIGIMKFDENGNAQYANQRACELLKETKENIELQNICKLLSIEENWRTRLQLAPVELTKTMNENTQTLKVCMIPMDMEDSKYVFVLDDISTYTQTLQDINTKLSNTSKEVNSIQKREYLQNAIKNHCIHMLECTISNLHGINGIQSTATTDFQQYFKEISVKKAETLECMRTLEMAMLATKNLSLFVSDLENIFDRAEEHQNISVDTKIFFQETLDIFRHTCLQQMEELEFTRMTIKDDCIMLTKPSYLRQLIYYIILVIYRKHPRNTIQLCVSAKPNNKKNDSPRVLIDILMNEGDLTSLQSVSLLKNDVCSILEEEILHKEGMLLIKYLAASIDCVVEIFKNSSGCHVTLDVAESQNQNLEPQEGKSKSKLQNQSLVLSTSQELPGEHEQRVRRLSNGLSLSLGEESKANHYHCLAVDDNKMNLLLIKRILQGAGVRVTFANDGYEAQRIVEEQGTKIDVILLDIVMPGISGYDVCRNIRQKFLSIELPIILLTAKGHVDNILDGFECGANDYLTKPFNKLELVARLFSHVRLARVNAAYNRFVPRQFLELLGKDLITDVSIGDNAQLVMPVMFTDIRSFTSISEQLTPKQVFDFLNILLEAFGPVIRAHDGFIDKFIGDAIMALFPSTPIGALRAAIAIIRSLNEIDFVKAVPYLKEEKVRVGVGIHTGPVIMGTVGECERMDTTVIADTVNIASRIEGLTKAFGVDILVTQNLLDAMRPGERETFAHRFVGKLVVKGKRVPLVLYEVFEADPEPLKKLKLETMDELAVATAQIVEGHYAIGLQLLSKMDSRDPVVEYYKYFCKAMSSQEGVTEVVLEKDGLVSQVEGAPVGLMASLGSDSE